MGQKYVDKELGSFEISDDSGRIFSQALTSRMHAIWQNFSYKMVELNHSHKRLSQIALKVAESAKQQQSILENYGLFGDMAWEMLLSIYIADVGYNGISLLTESLGDNARKTTPLRYLEMLEGYNFIVRTLDNHDKSRTIIRLTEAGIDIVELCLRA